MKAVIYFMEGTLQVLLGVLTVADAAMDSKKPSKVMNFISGTGFVVLGVLSFIAGGMKIKEQHQLNVEYTADCKDLQ